MIRFIGYVVVCNLPPQDKTDPGVDELAAEYLIVMNGYRIMRGKTNELDKATVFDNLDDATKEAAELRSQGQKTVAVVPVHVEMIRRIGAPV